MGGHVERRIGHLAQELHLLPGTTFSNIKERGVYDAAGNACLTLAELEWMVATIILERRATFHEGIGTAPLAKWESETTGRTLRMPADLRAFHRDFCRSRSEPCSGTACISSASGTGMTL